MIKGSGGNDKKSHLADADLAEEMYSFQLKVS